MNKDTQTELNETLTAKELASIQFGLAEIQNGQQIHHTYPIDLFDLIRRI